MTDTPSSSPSSSPERKPEMTKVSLTFTDRQVDSMHIVDSLNQINIKQPSQNNHFTLEELKKKQGELPGNKLLGIDTPLGMHPSISKALKNPQEAVSDPETSTVALHVVFRKFIELKKIDDTNLKLLYNVSQHPNFKGRNYDFRDMTDLFNKKLRKQQKTFLLSGDNKRYTLEIAKKLKSTGERSAKELFAEIEKAIGKPAIDARLESFNK
ncbi:hypothetical protein AGMMS50249_2420 [candidate division SR1 bacterium]|nr:hypothetical protein AGMMS50249_2420 [candidate division SR1 bacterium]